MPVTFTLELDLALELARRLQARRLELGYSRQKLGDLAAVSPETLRAFERSGQVSLRRLIRLADALGLRHELAGLFVAAPIRSLDDLPARRTRQRGRR